MPGLDASPLNQAPDPATHGAASSPPPGRAARPASPRAMLAVFLAALLLRILFVAAFVGFPADPATEPEPDAPQYEELARNLLERGEYFQVLNGVTYRAYRSPLFPLTVAGVYRVTGNSRAAARLFGCLLSSFVPLLLFLIARRFVPDRAALLVGLYAAAYPFFLFYAGLFLTETLYIALLHACLLSFLRVAEEPRPREAAVAGLLLGLVALARPVAYPLFAVFAVALLARRGFARAALGALALAGLLLALVVSPWFLRNHRLFGALVPGDTHGGNTLYGAYNHAILLHPEFAGSWLLPAPHEVPPDYRYDPLADDEWTQDRKFYELGRRFLRERPDLLPWLVWRRFVRFFSAWPSGAPSRKAASLLFYGPLLPLSLLGLYALRRRMREFLPLLLTLLVTLGLSLALVASVRMRNPVDGILMIASAAALAGARRDAAPEGAA